jgi:hypothetical protein
MITFDSQANPPARVISHVLVGGAATLLVRQVVGSRGGAAAMLATFALTAIVHELLDAPAEALMASLV